MLCSCAKYIDSRSFRLLLEGVSYVLDACMPAPPCPREGLGEGTGVSLYAESAGVSSHSLALCPLRLHVAQMWRKEQEGNEQRPRFQEMQILSAVSGRVVLRSGPPCCD